MDLRATEYRIVERTAVITLSRPHRANAWTGRMHAEYKHCVAMAEADPDVRVLVVTGAGAAFCVGGDSDALEGHAERGGYDDGLAAAGDRQAAGDGATHHAATNDTATNDGGTKDTATHDGGTKDTATHDGGTKDAVAADGAGTRPAGFGLHPEFDHQFSYHFGLSKPVIAAINGPAAGVGLALACYADLRFARPAAKLTTAHGKLNLPPEFGLSWMLPRHIGLTRAMELLLTSRVFLTDEAMELGLINQLHPAEELLDRTLAYADMLATTVSPGSLTASRQQVYLDQHRGVGASVEQSLELLGDMMGHADYRKGVEALRAKRPPEF